MSEDREQFIKDSIVYAHETIGLPNIGARVPKVAINFMGSGAWIAKNHPIYDEINRIVNLIFHLENIQDENTQLQFRRSVFKTERIVKTLNKIMENKGPNSPPPNMGDMEQYVQSIITSQSHYLDLIQSFKKNYDAGLVSISPFGTALDEEAYKKTQAIHKKRIKKAAREEKKKTALNAKTPTISKDSPVAKAPPSPAEILAGQIAELGTKLGEAENITETLLKQRDQLFLQNSEAAEWITLLRDAEHVPLREEINNLVVAAKPYIKGRIEYCTFLDHELDLRDRFDFQAQIIAPQTPDFSDLNQFEEVENSDVINFIDALKSIRSSNAKLQSVVANLRAQQAALYAEQVFEETRTQSLEDEKRRIQIELLPLCTHTAG